MPKSGLPTLVSFYGGDQYYHDCARELKADCQRLGVPHDIVEMPDVGKLDWAQICRLKVRFYREKLEEHGPILWMDVDARLLRRPEVLDGCRFDLAGFAGRYRYIREYDPYGTARFWVPSVLMFNDTPNGRAFVELMSKIEEESQERVTDDYVLQEAWLQFPGQLNLGFLAPSLAARSRDEITDETVFVLQSSGNVQEYRGLVVQHSNLAAEPKLRARVLTATAMDAMRGGDPAGAVLLMERAFGYQPDDPEVTQRFAEYLRKSGQGDRGLEVLTSFLERHPDAVGPRQTLAKVAVLQRAWDVVDEHLAMLVNHPDATVRAQAASLSFDADLERRADQRSLRPSERISLWWMKTPYPGNFGDILGPYIVELVSGAPPRFASRHTGMLAVGSIIKFARTGSVVWGAGTPRMSDTLAPDADYRAVRGPLTRQLVLSSGGRCPDVLGDPALLLPRFYSPQGIRPSYRLGLVRHVTHQRRPLRLEGVRDISLARSGYDGIEAVVDELLSCEAVLSTSLHGVITANAYGIPARWCFFADDPDAIAGDGTKFEDYFRSVGLPVQQPLDLSQFPVVDESLVRHVDTTVDLAFDADRLIDAFHG